MQDLQVGSRTNLNKTACGCMFKEYPLCFHLLYACEFSALSLVGPRSVTGMCNLHIINRQVCVSSLINAMEDIREEMRLWGVFSRTRVDIQF